MKPGSIIAGLVVAVVVIAAVVFTRRPAETPQATPEPPGAVPTPEARAPAPEFTRTSLTGAQVTLSQFRGQKNVIVNSWAVWCPFCVKELQDFATVGEEFKESFVILAVDRGETEDTQRSYLSNLEGKNLFESTIVFLTDPADEVYRLLGGFGMPVSVFINTRGEVTFVKNGPLTLEEMRQRMRETLVTVQ